MLSDASLLDSQADMPLFPPESIDLQGFNTLHGSWQGGNVEDIKRLFVREITLDDETVLEVETIKVPGFIGISDDLELANTQGESVLGHADIAKFLARDGFLICTFQWHKKCTASPSACRNQRRCTCLRTPKPPSSITTNSWMVSLRTMVTIRLPSYPPKGQSRAS